LKLVITIDTEEDNWGEYRTSSWGTRNIENIPRLQDLFDGFNVHPTYLITYPVTTDEKSLAILSKIFNEGRCEIGTHCHPWNTLPLEEEKTERNSMLCNLASDLQYRKLSLLHETIKKNLGVTPVSFRAGRWGYSKDVAKNIYELGYRIDTSISPYTDWTCYNGPDFTDMSPKPYRFSIENIFRESSSGPMVEIPATVGFLQQNFMLSNTLLKILSRTPVNKLRLVGILYRLRLLNKVWLSPELSDAKSMIRLTQRMLKKNYRLLNMSFHSTSLRAGLSPFVRTKDDERAFLQRIGDYLAFTRDSGIGSATLSDTAALI
jgi:hypothetical protein